MTKTVARKLAEIVAAGPDGLLITNGLTAGIRSLRDAGVVTVELVDAKRGPSGCGWYRVTASGEGVYE